jgi:hypothetical protein
MRGLMATKGTKFTKGKLTYPNSAVIGDCVNLIRDLRFFYVSFVPFVANHPMLE